MCDDVSAHSAGVLHKLSEFCGHLKDGNTEYDAVLHSGSEGSCAGEEEVGVVEYTMDAGWLEHVRVLALNKLILLHS